MRPDDVAPYVALNFQSHSDRKAQEKKRDPEQNPNNPRYGTERTLLLHQAQLASCDYEGAEDSAGAQCGTATGIDTLASRYLAIIDFLTGCQQCRAVVMLFLAITKLIDVSLITSEITTIYIPQACRIPAARKQLTGDHRPAPFECVSIQSEWKIVIQEPDINARPICRTGGLDKEIRVNTVYLKVHGLSRWVRGAEVGFIISSEDLHLMDLPLSSAAASAWLPVGMRRRL